MSDFNAEPIWAALLPRAFAQQEITWRGNAGEQHALVRCVLPGCPHKNGDQNPSLTLFRSGGFLCQVSRTKGGMKELVTLLLGADAWRELGRLGAGLAPRAPRGQRPKRTVADLPPVWDSLLPEAVWTDRFHIDYELAQRYLRSGPRWKGDIRVETHVAIYDQAGKLTGIKSRLPAGLTWPGATGKSATEKYRCVEGSKVKHVLFLLDRAQQHPGACVVFCAGEKDALVAASHLDPAAWAPVSGCIGEGGFPAGVGYMLAGRDVVIAYDPDEAGRAGATKLAQALKSKAASVRVATMPEGEGPRGEGKWDVAAVILAEGHERLEEILRAAAPLSAYREPGTDEDEGEGEPRDPGADEHEQGDGEPGPDAPDAPPPGPRPENPMDAWRVQDGAIVELVGSGKGLRPVTRFEGTLEVLRVESRWAEDPEEGWVEERRETLRSVTKRLGTRTHTIEAGPEAFTKFMTKEFRNEAHVPRFDDRARLWQFVGRVSTPKQDETRRAVGPSGDLGWLCSPGWAVRDGAVTRAPFTVDPPPGGAQELRRFRLDDLPRARLQELGRWVVDVLLNVDHHDGALTIPLLGAVLSPPLWHYLPTFVSWQRYALFIQGSSGVGKTQLTRYFMSFWGDFVSPVGMSTWRDSATTIEDLLHRVVGCPVFVSDWKKANFTRESEKSARALLQAYGDRSARGRSNVKAESQRKKEPRCQLILDGEDLPEGQESTLGRMVILRAIGVEAHEGRCATTDGMPDAHNVRDLPGLTAAWIAWVQRHVPQLTNDLEAALAEVDPLLPPGSANRSRIVRNYAAQVLAVRAFATFLELDLGLAGVVAPLHARSLSVHARHGAAQLAHVQGESAGDAFIRGLVAVLQAGKANLRGKGSAPGENPFPGGHGASHCVGTFDRFDGVAEIWPDAAIPIIQQHVSAGGGERIDFSRDAIGQQLREAGIIEESTSRSRVQVGARTIRPRMWKMRLEALGVEEEQSTLGSSVAGWPGAAPRAPLEGLPDSP